MVTANNSNRGSVIPLFDFHLPEAVDVNLDLEHKVYVDRIIILNMEINSCSIRCCGSITKYKKLRFTILCGSNTSRYLKC